MARFEIKTPKGTFEVNAPDEASAMQAIEGEMKALDRADQWEKVGGEAGAGELFGNSFTLGLKDKVAGLSGAVSGLFSGEGMREGYNTSQRAQEIIEERARERTGGAGLAAEIAGSIGTGALVKGPQAASWLGRIGQGAKESGKLATIQGVGDSTQDTVTGLLTDAGTSGALGLGLGAGLGTAVEAGRGLFRSGRAAVQGLGSILDNEAGRAGRKVTQALADDGISPQLAASRVGTRDTALINVADENVLGLGRAAAAKPGEGRKILTKAMDAQQKGSQGKVLSAVNQSLGNNSPVSFNRRVAAMVEDRATKANAMYEPAFKRNFGQGGHSMVFDDIATRVPGEAVKNAQRIAHAEGRPFGEQLIASIEPSGAVKFRRAPSLREWHYIQRGLRGATDAAYKSGVGEVGTAYKGLHRELLKAMDDASLLYKSARKAYASQSDLIEAIQRGREILSPQTTRNVDSLADEIAGMSASEREMMQIGLARQMQDMLEGTPDAAGDMVKKIFGNQAKRSAIRAAFGNDTKFRAFEAEMAKAAKEAKSFQYIRQGSRTSIVDAEKSAAGIASEAAGAVSEIATGGGLNVTLRATAKVLKDMGGMDEGVAREVAKILISKDPNLVLQALSPSMRRQSGQAVTTELLRKASEVMRALKVGAASNSASTFVASPAYE